MALFNSIALIVFVVLMAAASITGTNYTRNPHRVTLLRNALVLNAIAVVAAIIYATTLALPLPQWWKVAFVAAIIGYNYLTARLWKAIRAQHDTSRQRSFVQATVEEDNYNR